jgi:hypothetical protein
MLRELSRTEEALLTEFRRATNQLREQLHRFYAPLLQLPAFSANNPPAHARERGRKSLPGAGLRADGGG